MSTFTTTNISFLKLESGIKIIVELDYEVWQYDLSLENCKYCDNIDELETFLDKYIKQSSVFTELDETHLKITFEADLGFKKCKFEYVLLKVKILTEIEKLKLKYEKIIEEKNNIINELRERLYQFTTFPPHKKYKVKPNTKCEKCENCSVTLDWNELDETHINQIFSFDL